MLHTTKKDHKEWEKCRSKRAKTIRANVTMRLFPFSVVSL